MSAALAAALRRNPALAAEMRAVLADLIPQMVRYNNAMFSGATDPEVAAELNASAALTSELYHMQEALSVPEQAPKPARKPRQPKPAHVDAENTPQPLEELPDHGASVVGEPTDSAKGDAQ